MTLTGQPNFSSAGIPEHAMEHPDAPAEQFYETKLFRVVVSTTPWVPGHVVIERKDGEPHLYGFSTDAMDEFGYLLKKVSFWVMRFTGATGFSVVLHDGTSEVSGCPFRVHVVPRMEGSEDFSTVVHSSKQVKELEASAVQQMVQELRNLMQLPQEEH